MTRRILVVFILVIISIVIIVLIGATGLGKKVGAPGLDTLISPVLERFRFFERTGPMPDTTLPGNMNEIAGTWSGVSDVDGTEWQFTFGQNYAVRASSSTGYFHQGTAFIHWKLGLTDGNIRVPPGWSVLDVDIIQSSEPSNRSKISLGAFSMHGDVLKYCFCEPKRMVRPITDESREGIRCFDLRKAKAEAGSPVSPPRSVPVPDKSPSTLVPHPPPSSSAEATIKKVRVTNFHANILVQDDGTLLVHETIGILTDSGTFEQGWPLLSGIYRTISCRIQGRHAYHQLMGFQMIGATLDGHSIQYRVKRSGPLFKYVFIGPERLFLSQGMHEFTLDYKTDRRVAFFPDHDEIFWWIFGAGTHGWAESIGTVAVTVILPEGSHGIIASLDEHRWNVGTGKVPHLLRRASESGITNVLHYSSILSGKKSYLSVVVSMPKGTIHEPDLSQRVVFFFRDMSAYLPGIIGLSIFFAYYLIVWLRVGRDPEGKAIFPRYKPPADCSPAVARRLVTMGYDRTTFASALLNLASKEIIRLSLKGSRYAIEKTGTDSTVISPDEQVLQEALFGDKEDKDPSSKRKELDALTIHRAYRKHRSHLKTTINRRFFVRNASYLIPGILISLVVAALNSEIVDVRDSYVRELIGLGLWTILAGFITRFLSKKKVLELKRPSKLIYLLLLFPPVLYSVAVALSHSVEVFNIMKFMFLVPLFIMMTAHVVFLFLLRAPTHLGKKALDEIEGFRTYLAATEGDRLDRMTTPEKTQVLFQAYLPYALALGVENRWSENFSGEIDETYTLPPLDVFLSALSRLFSAKH